MTLPEATRVCVLIVDDDPDTRWMTAIALRDRYDVVSAASGVEALAAVHRQTPDAVVVDLTLERESGWELIRALQAEPASRRLPIVVLSARATVPRPAGVEPCAAHMTKPCRMAELRAVLERLVTKATPPGGSSPRDGVAPPEG